MARRIRTVDLELARAGPSDNQLLSPLTPYLALCGDFRTTVVQVPYQHQAFLRRLAALSYPRPDQTERDAADRQGTISELASLLADLLAGVPGLVSAMTTDAVDEDVLTHLNLVLTPAELALLPFELSKVPRGCPGGEDNWLALQTRSPISITRRVRGTTAEGVCWPQIPRILFVASAAGGSVPTAPHVQALLQAIQPWLLPIDRSRPGDLQQKTEKLLKILPNASIHEVEEECSRNAYTHVHILAHGIQDKKREGLPYGLAMRSRDGKQIDVVSGSRFATAIRPLDVRGQKGGGTPAVVTVASCDSGNVGSVVAGGASFAHELHQAGIPLVVASQFPLSFAGSVHLVEVLYRGLLWGEDPRQLLHDLRRKLFALHANDTHDWASVVAYAALPPDLEDQLRDTRYAQARAAIATVMDAFEQAQKTSRSLPENEVQALLANLDQANQRMPLDKEYETEGYGMLGSSEKRKAEALFRTLPADADRERLGLQEQSLKALHRSRQYYEKAVRQNLAESSVDVRRKRSLHGVLVQCVSLAAVLGEEIDDDAWRAVRLSAHADLASDSRETRAWALGSLAELYLLVLAFPKKRRPVSGDQARRKAEEYLEALRTSMPLDSFQVNSTRRQLRRYADWWCDAEFRPLPGKGDDALPAWRRGSSELQELAQRLVDLLPKR